MDSRNYRALCLALLTTGAGAGCGEDVAKPGLIEDLRVLAIRAEPPELLIDRAAFAPGGAAVQEVAFDALVVDPRGLPMVYEWRFCPVESNQTCADFAARRSSAGPAFQPLLDLVHGQNRRGQGPALDAFAVQIPAGLFDYHLADSALGLGNGAWASAVLQLQAGPETLTAQKRVVLGARDLSEWNPELAPSGWQVCPAAPAPAPPGCLPLRPRTANRNPQIAAVQFARGNAADAVYQPITGPIPVASKEALRFRPVLQPDAEEAYQAVESTLQGSQLIVVERTEEAIVSWFSTSGSFSDQQTTPQLSKNLDNTFTAPELPPRGAQGATAPTRIAIYLVVRDQRGGVGWTQLELQLGQLR